MPVITKELTDYKVTHYSRDSTNRVHLIQGLCKGSYEAYFNFYPDSATLQNNFLDSSGRIYLNFHESQFLAVMETLREESPVFAKLNDQSFVGWVSTGVEDIGEEEGS